MLTAFLVIGGLGLVLLVGSLIFGEVHEGLLSALDNDIFSGAVVAAFLSALGFTGALAQNATDNPTIATGAGLAAGIGVGYAARGLIRTLNRDDDDTTVRSDALPGRSGHVVEDIPMGGHGVVSIRVAGHLTRLNARADQPLRQGTAIVVTGVLSPTSVTVAPANPTPQDRVLPPS